MEALFAAQFRSMRRLVPWVLVSLIAVGTAGGAALGIAHGASSETPSQWVAALLATTRKAGTARFSFTQITSSPNVNLRGSLSGTGAANLVTGDARVTEVDHDVSFSSTNGQPMHPVHSTTTQKAIVIGGTVYQADPIPGISFTNQYHVLVFPKLPRSQRGLSLALNASVALATLQGPSTVASVRTLGPDTVDGAAATQYEVIYAPLHICSPHQPPEVVHQRPSEVWVDNAGRLVQVRSTSYFSDRLPRGVKLPAVFAGFPRGPMTTVSTLTFSEFGSPVHLVAPPASSIAPHGQSTGGSTFSVGGSCRSAQNHSPS
jgi:hypothetical protein